MATVGPYYSDQYTLEFLTTPPGTTVHRREHGNPLRIKRFTYTQAATGTAGDLVNLGHVPGDCMIILPYCFVTTSAWTASTVLDLGFAQYTEHDGDVIVADPDGLVDGLAISAVTVYFGQVTTVTTTNTLVRTPDITVKTFNSREPVLITANIMAVAPLAAATLEIFLAYTV